MKEKTMSVKTAAMDKMKNGNKPATTNGQKAAFPTTFKGYSSGQVGKFLSVFKEQVANALPKHIKPKRMIQVMTSLITRNPDLAECTTQSLVGSMLTASMLGLELVPQFGQCYLIPYKNKNIGNQKEAQFQLGYRGMLQLIQRHPMVKEAYAVKVYEEDTFHYEEGLNRDIKHIPAPDGEKKNLTHVYAVVKNINGGVSYVVLNRGDIARIREYSKSDKYDRNGTGFWNKHFDDMALKSAIRQLFKFAPVATDVQTRIGLDGKVINRS
jgi:recombination protein RecT